MRIGIPAETRPGESRVAATPETVRKIIAGHHTVAVQAHAGVAAGIPDADFQSAGAVIAAGAAQIYSESDLILKVRAPESAERAMLCRGSLLVGLLNPHDEAAIDSLAATGVTAFAMELIPRTTRAQTMDVLSSQANIAGYKAVVLAANEYGRFMPMLMTAAGTVKAARVLVLGAGVAGLQAIATAKRLGAVVEAFDVRPAVKEQVESLGSRFIEVPATEADTAAETAGGYAREMSDAYRQRQAALIDERARAADIVITTALIPGRPAPVLLREDTVQRMRPGSVIVDLAVEQGGNCPLTERDRVVIKHGVRLVGHSNLPALVAADASALYARNLLAFAALLSDPATGERRVDRADDIISATLVCIDGAPVRTREASLA